MRLRKDTDMVDFLKAVKLCKDDVYLETEDGDRLNLKSVLSQYVFVVIQEEDSILEKSRIICTVNDMEKLKKYMK